ncbi:Uu.00g106660.m01.CDS01 [Anthostomella pinea]|uniref:Uu.00g106660.m01.CDS01 n=1 Tax=Anthostomella pinea TaxID=933095 RepID=A0AAI8VE48_9PEZI|nr:Uu.00g106660.m01.CDS01 [Anthostomella pinea]
MANDNTTGLDASLSSLNSIRNDTSDPSSANIDSQQSKWTSASTSLTASPVPSRDPSPTRPPAKSGRTSRASTHSTRSRKNSLQDPSPSRSRSYQPTHSAIPRQQLSIATTPTLPPPSKTDSPVRATVPQKPSTSAEHSKDAPRWPISPRLKSPPPSLGRPHLTLSTRMNDQEPPAINVQHSSPLPHAEPASQSTSDSEAEDPLLSSGMRTPARGPSSGSSTLETVQEISQPNTPGLGDDTTTDKLAETTTDSSAKPSQNATNSGSGSDSGSVKANTRRPNAAAPPPALHNRQSSSALKFGGRGQTSGESSSRNMTVEEEAVRSIPQTSLVPNVGGQGVNGSLRTRPSTETIKPRKEKKKHNRKPTSVASGNASSKADIFEAKVASAVEEANSSDSDETFVYDSNPPEVGDRPRRYHSRTPSATSMVSQVDRNNLRSIHGVLEGNAHNLPVKKNMKFVNTYNSNGNDSVHGEDDGRGTARSNAGSARGTARHHHHHPRWGRNNGNNHTSIFDNESPFPNAARSKFSGNTSRQSSNPSSPRFNNSGRAWMSSSKRQMTSVGGYDLDDTTTTGADDERTPLLPTGVARSIRSNRSRRAPLSRNLEAQTYRRTPSFLNRFASCLVLTVMLLLVISGAIGFMFATSQPLTDIKLVKIGNVLASEQELMMDLTVRAHNPNVVVVMIDSADLEVFAKSPHAGTDSEWWRHPHRDDFGISDDPQDDPPDLGDPSDDDKAPNMRLGNILSFDSPLTYEGSFFQSGISTSTGELRLAHPGNGTDSGTERWERIISDDFILIVKGVIKYTLPLSQRVRSVAISGKATVKPNSANDPSLQPNRTEVGIY